jgi:hypothetical protein
LLCIEDLCKSSGLGRQQCTRSFRWKDGNHLPTSLTAFEPLHTVVS